MLYIGSENGLQIKRIAGASARPANITGFAVETKAPTGQRPTMGAVEIKLGPGIVKYLILEIADEGSGFNKTA